MASRQERLRLVFICIHPVDQERRAAISAIRSVDTSIRRGALENISKQLGLSTRMKERELPFYIGVLMLNYRRIKANHGKHLSESQIESWHKDVARAASTLLKLLKDERAIISRITPNTYWPPSIITKLEALEANASARPAIRQALSKNEQLKFPPKRKRMPDLSAIDLVERLGYLYFCCTRAEPGLTRDEYKRGKPRGPFFEIVKSAFELLGEPKTDEQIAMRIRRRTPILGKRRMGKPRRAGV